MIAACIDHLIQFGTPRILLKWLDVCISLQLRTSHFQLELDLNRALIELDVDVVSI